MILSNVDVHRAIDQGDIVLKPEPSPRLRSPANPESPYDTTAVNLRLAAALSVASDKKPFAFDLRTKGLPSFLTQVYTPLIMDASGGYVLKPGLFVLGRTIEWLELPIRPGRPVYAARVEGRSSFARCGLLVHFTAPTIHAGFEGTITLEIMNFGKQDIVLHPDLYIAQLVFEQVSSEPVRSDSQFHKQHTPAGTSS